jgi:hypothetical protein
VKASRRRKGWETGGRQRPCKHAGAVAIGRAYLMGAHVVPTREETPAESFRPGRHQLCRMEAA